MHSRIGALCVNSIGLAARHLTARTEEPATKTSVTALRNTSDNNAKNVDISY